MITANASTISNVRLLDPAVIPSTFTTLQSKFDFYQFSDLDVDRYQFNGQQTEVIIGARELNQDAIPQKTCVTGSARIGAPYPAGVTAVTSSMLLRDPIRCRAGRGCHLCHRC